MEGWIVPCVLVALFMFRDFRREPLKRKAVRYYVRWEQGVLDAILAGDYGTADRRRVKRKYWRTVCDRYGVH